MHGLRGLQTVLTDKAIVIREEDVPASEWRAIVEGKRAGTWTAEQRATYERFKTQAQLLQLLDGETREDPDQAYGIFIDVDGGSESPKFYVNEFQAAGVGSVIVASSASYLGAAAPRGYSFRITVVFDEPIPAEQTRGMVSFIGSQTRLPRASIKAIDPASDNPAQGWYWPTWHEAFGGGIEVYETHGGELTDGAGWAEELQREARKAAAPARAWAGSEARFKVEMVDFTSAVRVAGYDASDRHDWLRVGMAAKLWGAERCRPDALFPWWESWSAASWGSRPLQRPYAAEWATFSPRGAA